MGLCKLKSQKVTVTAQAGGQGTQAPATEQDQSGARALEMERLGRPIGDRRESPAAQMICAQVHGSENSTVSSLYTAIFKMYSSDVFIPCVFQFKRWGGGEIQAAKMVNVE